MDCTYKLNMKKNKQELIVQTQNVIMNRCEQEFEKGNLKGLYNALFLAGKYLYTFNLKFYDEKLEKYICYLADNIIECDYEGTNDGSIVFFDSLGSSNRGLSKIYIQALEKSKKKFYYITYREHYENNTELRKYIETTLNGTVYYIDRKFESIVLLYNLIKYAECIFLYTYPEDVIALSASYKAKGKKYLINFTDHAFWYGATILDYDIEFRDFGVNVSLQERKISEEKIIKIPFYPLIDDSVTFKGYPDEHMNKNNTVFSGGSVYKTLDDSSLYYEIVDQLLEQFDDIYFWYAGYGDYYKLRILQKKYEGRFFITGERKDLFQIMQHSRLFINTYPMIGGLMSQYAISAGIPAMTLISDESETGVLLKSGERYFEYYDKDRFLFEIEKLIQDDTYYYNACRNIKTEDLIMEKDRFNRLILENLTDEKKSLEYEKKPLSFEYLRSTYVQRFSMEMFCKAVCKKNFYMFTVFWKYYIILAFIFMRKHLGIE